MSRQITSEKSDSTTLYYFLLSEKVLGLIECKARLFDIAYGFYQSGPEGRKVQGKKNIKINR
mgnify:CR=1 FL=1